MIIGCPARQRALAVYQPPGMAGGEVGYAIPYQGEIVALNRAWNANRGVTAKGAIPILRASLKWAQDYLDEKAGAFVGTVGQAVKRDLDKAVTQLKFLIDLCQKQAADPYVHPTNDKLGRDLRAATLQPLYSASQLQQELSQRSKLGFAFLLSEMGKNLRDLPSDVARTVTTYVADQAKKMLPAWKVPGWLGPVVVGGASLAIGLGVWRTVKRR